MFGQPQAAAGLFGSSAGMNSFGPAASSGAGIFGSGLQQAQTQQGKMVATLDGNIYGFNPLLQRSIYPNVSAQQTQSIAAPAIPEKKPVVINSYRVTPRAASRIKLRGVSVVAAPPSLMDISQSRLLQTSTTGKSSPSLRLTSGPTGSPVVNADTALGLDSRFTPRRSVKRLVLDEGAQIGVRSSTMKTGPSLGIFDQALEAAADAGMTPFKNSALLSVIPAKVPQYVVKTSSPLALLPKSPQPISQKYPSPKKALEVEDSDCEEEYSMSPKLQELLLMSDSELKNVSGYSVSLSGIGSVEFLSPIDLLFASSTKTRAGISEIPGSIVIFESKLCTVYPNEDSKPPPGQGLNVPANISLLACWPVDKSTREFIRDPSDARYDLHLRKLMNMKQTTFLGFHQPTGTWKFRVEHFSKYGLLDDDEEISIVVDIEEFEEGTDGWAEVKENADSYLYVKAGIKENNTNAIGIQSSEDGVESVSDIACSSSENDESFGSEADQFEIIPVAPINNANVNDEQVISKPAPEIARRVQTMKAALFRHKKSPSAPSSAPIVEFNAENYGKLENTVSRISFSPCRDSLLSEKKSTHSPQKYQKAGKDIVAFRPVEYEKSTTNPTNPRADYGVFLGRSFRVGWGPSETFTVAGKYFSV